MVYMHTGPGRLSQFEIARKEWQLPPCKLGRRKKPRLTSQGNSESVLVNVCQAVQGKRHPEKVLDLYA